MTFLTRTEENPGTNALRRIRSAQIPCTYLGVMSFTRVASGKMVNHTIHSADVQGNVQDCDKCLTIPPSPFLYEFDACHQVAGAARAQK
jgi:hypothetical protein